MSLPTSYPPASMWRAAQEHHQDLLAEARREHRLALAASVASAPGLLATVRHAAAAMLIQFGARLQGASRRQPETATARRIGVFHPSN